MDELSNIRVGRPTSSDIYLLLSTGTRPMNASELSRHKKKFPKSLKKNCDHWPGAGAQTYIDECRMERGLLRTLENKVEVLAMSWGKLCEKVVHNKLGFGYIFHSDETLEHPELPEWVGTPDGSLLDNNGNTETITDIKCPLTMKAFCNLVSGLYKPDPKGFGVIKKKRVNPIEAVNAFREKSKDGEKFYWQLVSNACITGAKYAELIVFCPYHDELDEIHIFNNKLKVGYDKVQFAKDGELPFIHRKSGYENINIIRFEVPIADKLYLTKIVRKAIRLINKK